VSVNRKAQVLRQSPGLTSKTDRPGPSYEAQLNSLVNKQDEPELYRALAAEPGDHAHHKILLETIDKLFIGLNEEDQATLRNYIGDTHGSAIGNSMRNLVNMPGVIHQGRTGEDSIHQFARNQGYEIDSKLQQIGLARDILEASTVPSVKYRMHVADKYLTEAAPAMNNKINDLLTSYYDQGPSAKRFADKSVLDAYRQAVSGSTRTDSPGANRERSLNIDSGGGDVTIEEGVLRSNGKNGNGKNGKH